MTSLAALVGFARGSAPDAPNFMAGYIIFNALWAYTLTSTRAVKIHLGIDNHVNPRHDITTLGPAALKEGKITREQLERLKRNEAAHANSMEHLPLFLTAVVLAKIGGLSNVEINTASFAYTALRLAYFVNYVFSSTLTWAGLRPLLWWGAKIVCFRLIWKAGAKL